MKSYELWVFCKPQVNFVHFLMKHFPKIFVNRGHGDVPHPLTDKIHGQVQMLDTYPWIFNIVYWINEALLTKEGKRNIDILIQTGQISKVTSQDKQTS